MSKDKIDKLIDLVLKDAEDKRQSAGYSGSYSDHGASALETQVEFYRMGQMGEIPPHWEKYEKQLDPEYREYLRLKNKFEQEAYNG